uniref:Ig-like domain-containing protein n=1 Tax=uncultured Shewanella sp. TaxID=173975 RepID=UPI002626DE14
DAEPYHLDARIDTVDAAGNPGHANQGHEYGVDVIPPVAEVFVSSIANDDYLNYEESLPYFFDLSGVPVPVMLDASGNFIPSFPIAQDSDGDGLPDMIDIDADGDGLPDSVGLDNNPDTDGDGIIDDMDLDANNDGILDIQLTQDGDGDGIPDFVDSSTNSQGFSQVDVDQNNDGILDQMQIDLNRDGIPDFVQNEYFDTDSDGIPNLNEGVNANGIPNVALLDDDGDAIPDFIDLDANNDGVVDLVLENESVFINSDGIGLPDFAPNVSVTGYATGDETTAGDIVALHIFIDGVKTPLGEGALMLNAGGILTYNIPVSGHLLSRADSNIDGSNTVTASLTVIDTAQNSTTVTNTGNYQVDIIVPEAEVFISTIADDGWLNNAESDANVSITGYATSSTDNIEGNIVTLYVDINGTATLIGSGPLIENPDTGKLEYSIGVSGDKLSQADDNQGEYTVAAFLTVTDNALNSITVTNTNDYQVDTTPPAPLSITLDPNITDDDIINTQEAEATLENQPIWISGKVAGEFNVGELVTLTIQTDIDVFEVTTPVINAQGDFQYAYSGALLVADIDKTIKAEFTSTDQAGNSRTVFDDESYTVDTQAPNISITINEIVEVLGQDDDPNAPPVPEFFNVTLTGTITSDQPFGPQDFVEIEFNGTIYDNLEAGDFDVIITPNNDINGSNLFTAIWSLTLPNETLRANDIDGDGAAQINARYNTQDPAGNQALPAEASANYTINKDVVAIADTEIMQPDAHFHLDIETEYGAFYIDIDGTLHPVIAGENSPVGGELVFIPEIETFQDLVEDVNLGSSGIPASLYDWGEIDPNDLSTATFYQGALKITTQLLNDDPENGNPLTVYNGNGDVDDHVGNGIGGDNNGLEIGESLMVTIDDMSDDPISVNEVTLVLKGLGSWFDENDNNATEVLIIARDIHGNEIDRKGDFRDSGIATDTYKFTSDVAFHSFELTTQLGDNNITGNSGSYVVHSMILSQTLLINTPVLITQPDLTTTTESVLISLTAHNSDTPVPITDLAFANVIEPVVAEIRVMEDDVLVIHADQLLHNDYDLDPDSNNNGVIDDNEQTNGITPDPLFITHVTATANTHGTLVFDTLTGEITYTPDPGYSGPASFEYTITDSHGADGTTQVKINVIQDYAEFDIMLNPIAGDGLINYEESFGPVALSGRVDAEFDLTGETVMIEIDFVRIDIPPFIHLYEATILDDQGNFIIENILTDFITTDEFIPGWHYGEETSFSHEDLFTATARIQAFDPNGGYHQAEASISAVTDAQLPEFTITIGEIDTVQQYDNADDYQPVIVTATLNLAFPDQDLPLTGDNQATLIVNNQYYTGFIDPYGFVQFAVDGQDMASDSSLSVIAMLTDEAGNSFSPADPTNASYVVNAQPDAVDDNEAKEPYATVTLTDDFTYGELQYSEDGSTWYTLELGDSITTTDSTQFQMKQNEEVKDLTNDIFLGTTDGTTAEISDWGTQLNDTTIRYDVPEENGGGTIRTILFGSAFTNYNEPTNSTGVGIGDSDNVGQGIDGNDTITLLFSEEVKSNQLSLKVDGIGVYFTEGSTGSNANAVYIDAHLENGQVIRQIDYKNTDGTFLETFVFNTGSSEVTKFVIGTVNNTDGNIVLRSVTVSQTLLDDATIEITQPDNTIEPLTIDKILTNENAENDIPLTNITESINAPVFEPFEIVSGETIFISFADLTVNDSDPEGNPINIIDVQAGANSQFDVMLGDMMGEKGVFVTAADDFSGESTFTYTLIDDRSGQDTATVTVIEGDYNAPDVIIPESPEVVIVTDSNDDGWLSAAELEQNPDQVQVWVSADQLSQPDSYMSISIDNNGAVTQVLASLNNGTLEVTDAAGNGVFGFTYQTDVAGSGKDIIRWSETIPLHTAVSLSVTAANVVEGTISATSTDSADLLIDDALAGLNQQIENQAEQEEQDRIDEINGLLTQVNNLNEEISQREGEILALDIARGNEYQQYDDFISETNARIQANEEERNDFIDALENDPSLTLLDIANINTAILALEAKILEDNTLIAQADSDEAAAAGLYASLRQDLLEQLDSKHTEKDGLEADIQHIVQQLESDDNLYIVGTDNNDDLKGWHGNDVIQGLAGDDILLGEGGNDILLGDEGEDVLIGGSGNDILIGGEGMDTFKFSPNDGTDLIKDFNLSEDRIDISSLLDDSNGLTDLEQQLNISLDADGNTLIDIDSSHDGDMNQHIVLDGVDLFTHFNTDNTSEIINALINEGNGALIVAAPSSELPLEEPPMNP